MPFTNDFLKIRRHFSNLYSDKARVDTFAFEEARIKGIETFTDRKPKKKFLKDSLDIDI